jgi:hypothetical protein
MTKRQPDGKWRSRRQAVVISAAVLRARWIEAEALHLKVMGLSFQAIAEHLTRVGHSQTQPLTKISEGVTFPPDYKISRQACFKAVQKTLGRETALRVEQLRKIDNARSEELFLNLQPDVRKGKVPAIVAAVKVLDHAARINNLAAAPRSHELISEKSGPRLKPGMVLDTFSKAFRLMADMRLLPPGYIDTGRAVARIEVQDTSCVRHDLVVPDEGKGNEEW